MVAAAGNENWNNNTNIPGNRSSYPASYRLPDLIISVGASDCQGAVAGFSNYGTINPPLPATLLDLTQPGWGINEARWGLRGVDLTAPGVDIIVLRPMCGNRLATGTSCAAPFVSGVAALVWAENPALNGAGVKGAILANVDFPAGAAGWTITGGRLNGFKALASVLTRIQRLQMLLNKLLPGALPPGWNIRTIKELLLKELKKMREEGICGLELDELIEAIEKLPDEMPEGGIDDEILEKLKKIIDQLKEECSVRGQIAFVSDRDGNFEIYVMNADGSNQTNLTNNPAGDRYPDW